MYSVTIIIPAFNEEKRLPPTLRSIERWMCQPDHQSLLIEEIILVDDGSADATRDIALSFQSSLPIRVLHLPHNKGKGAAIKTGMLEAKTEWVLLFDADGATSISEIIKLVRHQEKTHVPIIIGSRLVDASTSVAMQRHRRMIGWIYHVLTSPLIPGIRDASCGFKLMKRDIASELFTHVRTDGYGYDVEFLALAQRRKIQVEEVQVHWNAIFGSKVHVIRDGMAMFISACALYFRLLF